MSWKGLIHPAQTAIYISPHKCVYMNNLWRDVILCLQKTSLCDRCNFSKQLCVYVWVCVRVWAVWFYSPRQKSCLHMHAVSVCIFFPSAWAWVAFFCAFYYLDRSSVTDSKPFFLLLFPFLWSLLHITIFFSLLFCSTSNILFGGSSADGGRKSFIEF